jgi:hypothetical protein
VPRLPRCTVIRALFAVAIAVAAAVPDCTVVPVPNDPSDASLFPHPEYVDRECSVPHAPGSTFPPCCEACTRLGQLGCEHWGEGQRSYKQGECGVQCNATMPTGVWAAEVANATTPADVEWILTRYVPGYVCKNEGDP